jgi:predicted DNA-binding WGR domain protein
MFQARTAVRVIELTGMTSKVGPPYLTKLVEVQGVIRDTLKQRLQAASSHRHGARPEVFPDSRARRSCVNEGRGTMELAAEQAVRCEYYVRLVRCNPEQNRQRFYLFSWQRSLYGKRVLVCTWGRMGTLGRSRSIFFPEGSSGTSLERLINQRLQRGYHVTAWC